MAPKQAVAFVKDQGIVLESARGPVPSLAEAVAGEPIRGNWWAHPRANEIFLCSRAIRKSADVLVCRLVGGKVTYVHRRLWPALARLAARFRAEWLAAIQEVHTRSGRHEVRTTAFADWLSADVRRAAERLTEDEATALLPAVPRTGPSRKRAAGKPTRAGAVPTSAARFAARRPAAEIRSTFRPPCGTPPDRKPAV
jgi:hypothetical protein